MEHLKQQSDLAQLADQVVAMFLVGNLSEAVPNLHGKIDGPNLFALAIAAELMKGYCSFPEAGLARLLESFHAGLGADHTVLMERRD